MVYNRLDWKDNAASEGIYIDFFLFMVLCINPIAAEKCLSGICTIRRLIKSMVGMHSVTVSWSSWR